MAQYTNHKKLALLLISFQAIITLLFFIGPACLALIQSVFFSDAFGLHNHFAALTNFVDLLHDPDYAKAILVTAIIAFSVTLVTLSFGLLLAVLLQNCGKSKGIYKSLLLWPYAVAPAVAAILWRFICQPTIGWFAQGLQMVGIHFNYLTHAGQALLVVIVTASWQQFSYNFLFFFAAMQAIPRSLIEAAILDGASGWQRFWHIIFPLLSPTAFFLLIMNLIYAFFDTFAIIDVMTRGGPGNSTTTLIYKVYKDGFVGMDPGSSSAQAVVLMVMVIMLTLIQFRYLERKVHYT